MGFSRQEYRSGLPWTPPGDLPDPGIEPASLTSPALAGVFFTTSTTWESAYCITLLIPASSLSVTLQHKMAAGAPAITSHLTNREEEMKNGTPSLSPIRTLPRSYAHKSSYFHRKRNMAELIVWQIGLGNLVFILVATSSAKN